MATQTGEFPYDGARVIPAAVTSEELVHPFPNWTFYILDLVSWGGIYPEPPHDHVKDFPEVYEVLAPVGSPPMTWAEEAPEEDVVDSVPVSPSGPAIFPLDAISPILDTRGKTANVSMLVVKVPNEHPVCPCCGVRMGKMATLIDHL